MVSLTTAPETNLDRVDDGYGVRDRLACDNIIAIVVMLKHKIKRRLHLQSSLEGQSGLTLPAASVARAGW